MPAERIREIVTRELGWDLGEDDVFDKAVAQRMAERRLSITQYEMALADPHELHALGQLLTVGETYFFRMRAHYEVLRNHVANIDEQGLSVLSAGCSTGEEAYSLAIALRSIGKVRARVTGIDLNQRSLEAARAASYTDWALRAVAAPDRDRWFNRNGKRWDVRSEIREMVDFRPGNLLEDGAIPLGPFDAIFCRNVLLYFTRDATRTAVARLTASLRSGGLLFLGPAETLRGISEEYALEQHADLFHYRHRRASSRPPPSIPAPTRPSTRRGTPPPLSPPRWLEPPPPDPTVGPDVMNLMAEERFREALAAMGPEPTVFRAVALLNIGETSAAEDVCTKLIGDEDGAEAHYVLGLVAEARGDRNAAIDRHRAVLYLDPDFALAHLQLGRLERREGNHERARRDLRHALELLTHEKAARIALFAGGFNREALIALGRAELAAL